MMWWRVTLIVLISLLLTGTVTTFIYYGVTIYQDRSHIQQGFCEVLYCNNNRFWYQWFEIPRYRGYYNGTPIGCPRELQCGFDDRSPLTTFGGWIHNGSEVICIGGTCNLSNDYPEWYLLLIIAVVIEAIALLATVLSYLRYRRQAALDLLIDSSSFPEDVLM